MQFEQQRSPSDDDDNLPAELAPLAARLAREADALAALYPAQPNCEPRGRIALRKRRWPLAAAAAALLLAAGIGSALRWFATPDVARDDGAQRDVALPIAAAPRPSQAQPAGNLSLPGIVPAMLFHNLSAPQQEAVLDLLDDRDTRDDNGDEELTRVSI